MQPTIANAKRNMLSVKEQDNKYQVAGEHIVDINSSTYSHNFLAKNALGSKKILDVGCGVGYIGEAIKKIQKCHITGIELDKVSANIASQKYDTVLNLKIGDLNDPEYLKFLKSKKKYDCIICGDIIEHLADPGDLLAVLAKKLDSNGKILVSIPNLAHIDVIAGLIDGKFNYAPNGILDTTHLRFWTENSFYDFIANINDRYDTKIFPKLIARTYADNTKIDSASIGRICGSTILCLQNIFELKLKNGKVPKVKYPDNFSKVASALSSAEKVNDLQKQVDELTKKIQSIENSASWKVTKPLRKINSLFK